MIRSQFWILLLAFGLIAGACWWYGSKSKPVQQSAISSSSPLGETSAQGLRSSTESTDSPLPDPARITTEADPDAKGTLLGSRRVEESVPARQVRDATADSLQELELLVEDARTAYQEAVEAHLQYLMDTGQFETIKVGPNEPVAFSETGEQATKSESFTDSDGSIVYRIARMVPAEDPATQAATRNYTLLSEQLILLRAQELQHSAPR